MPMQTRYQKRHASIRTVHPVKVEIKKKKVRGKRNKVKLVNILRPVDEAIILYIENNGIKTFFADVFTGDIDFGDVGVVARSTIIDVIDTNPVVRGYISNKWRKEDAHNHEWIPCTYLSMMMVKALRTQDARYLILAHRMRSLTKSLIFKPKALGTNACRTVHHGPFRVVTHEMLGAHPGGLKLACPPGGPFPTGSVNCGNKLQAGSETFHSDLIHALQQASTAANLVDRLLAVFQAHCWNGTFPVNGHLNTTTLWPLYKRGDGTAVDLNGGFLVTIGTEYAGIQGDFATWRQVATAGHLKNAPDRWDH